MPTTTRARLVALLALAVLVAACDSRSSAPSPAPASNSGSSVGLSPRPPTVAPAAAPLEYIERLTGGARSDEALPLIVAMHGLGDRPESFGELFASFDGKARVVILRAPDAWGDGFSWFPFRPNDGDALRSRGMSDAAERVVAMLGVLTARRPTRGKPIVTGFSQGGMLSFTIFARHPELVQAAFPIGGALPEPLWPSADAAHSAARLVALHGESDDRVPLGPTRAAVDALGRRGFEARIETFPGVGHRIPAELRARYFELLREELSKG